LKRSLANLVKQDIDQLTALVRTRLRRMQYQPGLLDGFHLARSGLAGPAPAESLRLFRSASCPAFMLPLRRGYWISVSPG
jgi:hypothetical protein